MRYSSETYRGVRVLVTGATGFVGRWVALALSRAGADLFVNAREVESLKRVYVQWGIQAKPLISDLSRRGTFRYVFREAQPAVVFHLTGYGVDPLERDETTMRRINVELTEEIVETIATHADTSGWPGLRLLSAGSAFEYGIQDGPISETAEPTPNSFYALTKLEGTRCIQAARERSGLRGTSARLTTVYGPGEHPSRLLPSLVRTAETSEPLELTGGKQERDFTFVGDVAEGFLRLGALGDVPHGVVNLATGRLSTVRSFVDCAREVLGIRADLLRVGAIPYRDNEVWQGRIDVDLLENLTGWRPRIGIDSGIAMSRDFLAAEAMSSQ
jgi:UDP-glucose 4-epimerase